MWCILGSRRKTRESSLTTLRGRRRRWETGGRLVSEVVIGEMPRPTMRWDLTLQKESGQISPENQGAKCNDIACIGGIPRNDQSRGEENGPEKKDVYVNTKNASTRASGCAQPRRIQEGYGELVPVVPPDLQQNARVVASAIRRSWLQGRGVYVRGENDTVSLCLGDAVEKREGKESTLSSGTPRNQEIAQARQAC